MPGRAQGSQDRLIHRLYQADLCLPLGPPPHTLLETRVASSSEHITNFLRCESLQRLITPTIRVSSLVRIIFKDDVSLIGCQRTGQERGKGYLRDNLSVGALCHSSWT